MPAHTKIALAFGTKVRYLRSNELDFGDDMASTGVERTWTACRGCLEPR